MVVPLWLNVNDINRQFNCLLLNYTAGMKLQLTVLIIKVCRLIKAFPQIVAKTFIYLNSRGYQGSIRSRLMLENSLLFLIYFDKYM